MKTAAGIAVIIAIVLFVLFMPYFTWASMQALTNGDGTFTIGDFFSALWLLLIVGGLGFGASKT